MSRHQGRRTRCGVALAVLTTSLLAACSTDAPETTTPPPTAEQTPLDPYDSSEIGRTWQQEVVSIIVDVGRSRPDVGDDDIVAALTASYAESEWSIRLTGRNLLGWTTTSINDPIDSPNSKPEVERALDGLYNRLANSLDADISARALDAQVHDTSKRTDYFANRPCEAERKQRPLCTPDLASATYRDALPKAEAAYSQLGR